MVENYQKCLILYIWIFAPKMVDFWMEHKCFNLRKKYFVKLLQLKQYFENFTVIENYQKCLNLNLRNLWISSKNTRIKASSSIILSSFFCLGVCSRPPSTMYKTSVAEQHSPNYFFLSLFLLRYPAWMSTEREKSWPTLKESLL